MNEENGKVGPNSIWHGAPLGWEVLLRMDLNAQSFGKLKLKRIAERDLGFVLFNI